MNLAREAILSSPAFASAVGVLRRAEVAVGDSTLLVTIGDGFGSTIREAAHRFGERHGNVHAFDEGKGMRVTVLPSWWLRKVLSFLDDFWSLRGTSDEKIRVAFANGRGIKVWVVPMSDLDISHWPRGGTRGDN